MAHCGRLGQTGLIHNNETPVVMLAVESDTILGFNQIINKHLHNSKNLNDLKVYV